MLNRQYVPASVVGVCALLVSAVLVALFDDGVLSNDFAQTVSVARNLIDGSGLQTDLIYYDVHYAMQAPRVPQTVFPPGQSLLVAPLMMAGASSYAAAFTWSLIAFLASGVFIFLTMRRLDIDDSIVVVVSVAWLMLGANWSNVLACRSESLLIAVTTVGLYGFVRWLEDGCKSRRCLLLVGAAAACAFLFRYQGVFFIAAVGLYFFARAVILRKSGAVLDLAAVSILPLTVVVIVSAYNAGVTGGLGGGPIDHSQHSAGLYTVALGYYYEISKILGVSREALVRGGASEIAAIALTLYVVFVLIRVPGKSLFGVTGVQSRTCYFCAIYIGLSLLALVYLSLTKSLGYTQARYMSTLLPFVLVVLGILSNNLRRVKELRSWQRILGVTLVISFVGFGQARAITEQLNYLAADSRLSEIRTALLSNYSDTQSIEDFLRSEIDAGKHLLANQSQLVGHLLERGTFGLTPALFTSRDFDFEEVRRMADVYHIEYVVLFPNLYDPAAMQNENRKILTELANRNMPGWITPVFEAHDVRLYKIDQDL